MRDQPKPDNKATLATEEIAAEPGLGNKVAPKKEQGAEKSEPDNQAVLVPGEIPVEPKSDMRTESGNNIASEQETLVDKPRSSNNVTGIVIVGILLSACSVFFAVELFLLLLDRYTISSLNTPIVDSRQITEALVMMCAGGIGSLICAIRAYLLHACDRRDFDIAYIPWYFFWQFQGMFLGLMFYFAIRGGLMLATISERTQSITNLNIWALAGIGALAGLFSKYALEKLRQIFIIVFSGKEELTKADVVETEAEIDWLVAEISKKKLQVELEAVEQTKLEAELSRKKLELS